ncbi:hypothetical protein AB6A40_010613 [Gnathostoma spinigerum]|uniref:M-phase inducer phosphatase n=1 Tax=Gnathostoma spinigerum TaxID=75299 RepID=A0ABD6F060_9BILA
MFFPIFDDEYICQSNVAIDVDPDSRDSGISVGTSMENDSVIDFASTYPTKLLGPQSSSSELDDRMDELAIEESLVDLSAFEYQTEQEFRKKRVKNVALTYRKPLGEITNSSQIDESPKSRLKTTWKTYVSRSQLNTVVRQFGRQTSCVETSSTVVRKRNINDNTDNNVKRRAITQIMNDENTEKTVVQSQKSTLLTRVHSTSSLENGRYAKGPRDDQLPKVWHVEYSLDVVSKPFVDSVAFKSISGSTLSELISTMNNDEFQKKYMLVDCRYPYEYSGGHIKNAINLFDPTLVPDMFYPEKFDATNARIPIFYCEYSQKRGPSMAAALRQYDRQRNESRYPEIDYKEIYLLDRGYKKFFLDDAFTVSLAGYHIVQP